MQTSGPNPTDAGGVRRVIAAVVEDLGMLREQLLNGRLATA